MLLLIKYRIWVYEWSYERLYSIESAQKALHGKTYFWINVPAFFHLLLNHEWGTNHGVLTCNSEKKNSVKTRVNLNERNE